MKRIFIKSVKVVATILIIFVLALMPYDVHDAHALVPPLLPFGGYANFTYPCTCSFALWGYFTPLYIGGAPLTGPLVYFPAGTFLYPKFLVTVPSVPHLGAFIPGVQACWQYAGYFCFVMPSYGVMAFVGTGI